MAGGSTNLEIQADKRIRERLNFLIDLKTHLLARGCGQGHLRQGLRAHWATVTVNRRPLAASSGACLCARPRGTAAKAQRHACHLPVSRGGKKGDLLGRHLEDFARLPRSDDHKAHVLHTHVHERRDP